MDSKVLRRECSATLTEVARDDGMGELLKRFMF
jgi:hypothetical protein